MKKELPTNWKWVTVDDVCDFLDSQRIPINEAERQTRIANKQQSELFPYYGANGQVGWIDGFIFDEPLILLAEDGGKFGSSTDPIAYEVSGRYWVNNHAHVLRPRRDLINFRYCLHSIRIRPDILPLVAGTTRQKLNQAKAAQIPVPLPPLAEQERIVRLLDEAGSLRCLRARADARMGDFIPALFHEMFGDLAESNYPIKLLSDVAKVVSGVAKGRRLGSSAVIVPYLRVANVQAGYLDLAEIKTIEALPSEVEELALKKGDVLLTEGGDFDKLGRGAMLEVDLPPNCIHQNHVFRVRVTPDKLVPIFFADYLQTSAAKMYFLQCAKKTTNLASINMTQLRGLPVPLPPLPLQHEFSARVAEARALQAQQAQSRARLSALFESLLARAFAGEL